MLDNDILDSFRQQAHAEGLGYQTLINRALRAHTGEHLWDERVLRKIIREEVHNSLIDKGWDPSALLRMTGLRAYWCSNRDVSLRASL